MTTTITVSAHCDPTTTEVLVIREYNFQLLENITLQDGDTMNFNVYDTGAITVREVTKGE